MNSLIPTLHSKLGASSYSRWGACPGSVALTADLPEETSAYAAEGTLAHDIASKLLDLPTDMDRAFALGEACRMHGPEMIEAIEVYLEHAAELRKKTTFFSVEQRVSLEKVYPGLFGTADLLAYDERSKMLYVSDYKHGAGVAVEVKNSKQLMYYGLGALLKLNVPVKKIVLTIIQPRCYHVDGPVRSWETDSVTILDFAAQLEEDAKATEDPNAPLHPGDHCRWCKAKPFCPALKAQALEAVQSSFTDLSRYDDEQIADFLDKIPRIKAWCEAVHSYAHKQAELGNAPRGWKLVDKRAIRRWSDRFLPELAADDLGVEESALYEAPKLKSPAQVEKIPGINKKVLNTLVVKESSGKTLVPAKDDRPQVEGRFESMFDVEGE